VVKSPARRLPCAQDIPGFVIPLMVAILFKEKRAGLIIRPIRKGGENMKIKIIVALVIFAGLGALVWWKQSSGNTPTSIFTTNKEADSKTAEMAAIRTFMADPELELSFVNTDLPMPYFRVGKVTKTKDGENMEAVDGWTRQVNVYENAKPLSDSCGVYQYHIDPRSHTLTQAVTRGLRPNEIEALKQKGTPCIESKQTSPAMTKSEAQDIAFGYLSRALPNFEEIKDQFIYSQDLKAQTWLWENKNYQLPERLEGRPYPHPVIRLTVFSNGQILYWNTVSLFES